MTTPRDVLASLTVDQATAAALPGAVLVLAGAGTGKTKTLAWFGTGLHLNPG